MTPVLRWTETWRGFWGREERLILGLNLAMHALIQCIAVALMPLAYFSELSLHDGHVYYSISEQLWPEAPIWLLSWHKRILLPVLANVTFPWDKHVSFLIIGVGAASLSAVFFYKIARQYVDHALEVSVLYSALPWLVFSAHHALSEPLMMLFLLAGFYYFLGNRPWMYTGCFALALLSKELALLPILAMGVLVGRRYGWRRAAGFALAVLPFGLFCLAYGLHWGDCLWCLKESPENALENSFSWKTGLWWMYRTLRVGTESSANRSVAFWYDVANQALNLAVLVLSGLGLARLRRIDSELFIYNLIVVVPLLFLGRNQYMLSSSLGRQFLVGALVMISLGNRRGPAEEKTSWLAIRPLFVASLIGMILLGGFWIVLYSRYFVYYEVIR
jgi:hypothetical protein